MHKYTTFSAILATICILQVHAQRPNMVYILADDLGYGDLGCYGQEVIQTPNLDRMAAQGIRFTNHYAGSTVCAPSRSCLLEGKHSGNTFVRGNGSLQMRSDPQDIIFPKALKDAGYHTAMIGKSGLGCNTDDAGLAFKKGFDYFFGFTSHTAAHWYYPNFLWRNDAGTVTKVEYAGNTKHSGKIYSSDVIINEAINYIEHHKSAPFFLHLSLQIPHASLVAKEAWKEKYRPIIKEKLLNESKQNNHYTYEREPKTTYAAMVSYMDHNIGILRKKLEDLGIAEKTLVVFSSDNGAMAEGGHNRQSFNSSGILRGGKRDLYEGGLRTPMIACWPGKIKPGQVSDHVSAFWDISPTLRELALAEAQHDTDGISLVPTLLGEGIQQKHKYLYWEFYEQGGKRAILQGQWKLLLFDTNEAHNPKMQLFDLSKDISEQNNLMGQHSELVAELLENMKSAHSPAEHKNFRLACERPPNHIDKNHFDDLQHE